MGILFQRAGGRCEPEKGLYDTHSSSYVAENTVGGAGVVPLQAKGLRMLRTC